MPTQVTSSRQPLYLLHIPFHPFHPSQGLQTLTPDPFSLNSCAVVTNPFLQPLHWSATQKRKEKKKIISDNSYTDEVRQVFSIFLFICFISRSSTFEDLQRNAGFQGVVVTVAMAVFFFFCRKISRCARQLTDMSVRQRFAFLYINQPSCSATLPRLSGAFLALNASTAELGLAVAIDLFAPCWSDNTGNPHLSSHLNEIDS